MTAVYQNHGIEFLYPENWVMTEGSSEVMPYEVTLETPRGGLWILNAFPAASDPENLGKDVLDTFVEQYDGVESFPARQQFAGQITDGYDVNFFYLDLLIEANIRYFRTEEYTIVLLTQAEDRIYQEVAPVFAAITTSLIENLRGSRVPASQTD